MTQISFPTIPTAPVTQLFNNYNPSFYGGDGKHKGIDYGIPVKSQIYSCMAGKVTMASVSELGYGRHLRIMHTDGSLAIYGHLAEFRVSEGDMVDAGELIALSGGDPKDSINGDGASTGAHLHWEIRPPGRVDTDQSAVDPEEYCLAKLGEKYSKGIVNASNGLRIRTRPIDGDIVGMLKNKEEIKFFEIATGWVRLRSLRDAWCSSDYISNIQQGSEVPTPTPDPLPSAEIRDIIETLNAAIVRLENIL